MRGCNRPACKIFSRFQKDNSAYIANAKARENVKKYGELPVPLHLRNAPTALMKDLGYGKGYEYDHDLENKKSSQKCLPDELCGREYFGF